MGDLERDITPSGSNGRFTIPISEDWRIWGPNGGYLAAVALRTAGLEAEIQRPASIVCHFLGVARFEQAELETNIVHRGRSSESIHVTMTQHGRPILQAMVRTAAEVPGVEHDFAQAPDAPHPESLKTFLDYVPDPPNPVPFWENIESRIIHTERVMEMEQAFETNLLEWYRFQPRATFDDPFVDAARYALLLDTFAWPTAANAHPPSTRTHQAVNMDVVSWFHRPAPESEWLLCDYDSPIAHGGLVGSHGRIWSLDGKLIASGGAQCMSVPMPEPATDGQSANA
jgi:acyl-CoA thioesterase II